MANLSTLSRDELEVIAVQQGVDDPDSYPNKSSLIEAIKDTGYREGPDTSFEAAQGGAEYVVNTPLNAFGLPDPDRVVTKAFIDDDGAVTYEGGGS